MKNKERIFWIAFLVIMLAAYFYFDLVWRFERYEGKRVYDISKIIKHPTIKPFLILFVITVVIYLIYEIYKYKKGDSS